MQAKKKYGQNFLKDELVVSKIVRTIDATHNIVEIGAGLGDLTSKLLLQTSVKSYEVDSELIPILQTRFAKEIKDGRFTLIHKDILSAWESGNLEEENYDIVANLPYYIATAIILKALKDTNCKNMTLMIQKEVAEKFAANPKDKEFGSLAILAQLICNVKILFDVPPSAFEPQPKVTSSVIRFEKFANYDANIEKFEKFLKLAFMQPRKTLMKNLTQAYAKKSLEDIFASLDLTTNARGHEIDIESFKRIFEKLNEK